MPKIRKGKVVVKGWLPYCHQKPMKWDGWGHTQKGTKIAEEAKYNNPYMGTSFHWCSVCKQRAVGYADGTFEVFNGCDICGNEHPKRITC